MPPPKPPSTTSTAAPTTTTQEDPGDFSMRDLGEMIMNLSRAVASHNKALMESRFDQDAMAKKQDLMNEQLLLLAGMSDNTQPTIARTLDHTDPPKQTPPTQRWRPPPSKTAENSNGSTESTPSIRVDPPQFTGDDPTGWIRRVQKYFNYYLTSEPNRLSLVHHLIDHPASEWLEYFEANNPSATWEEFLVAFRLQFDPHIFEDYLGQLSKLKQTTTVLAYQLAFQALLNKVSNQSDETLISLFVSGLKQPIQKELTIHRPMTLQEAFALAKLHSITPLDTSTPTRTWQPRDRQPLPSAGSTGTGTGPKVAFQPNTTSNPGPMNIPTVRVTAAQRTERSRKGLCWYCEEPWDRAHVCSKKFWVLMGDDEDTVITDPEELMDEDAENMLISGDVSTVQVLTSSARPRSFRITGIISDQHLSVLIDGGSTHNFISPTVAEKLSLPLTPIAPFRVFVGNGESLRCSYVCPQTPITLQGHKFCIDLFILKVKGPDVVLGVQWLQELGDVTKNYKNLTMKFEWDKLPIFLKGDGPAPRPITYNALLNLMACESQFELFEILPIADKKSPADNTARESMPSPLQEVVDEFPMVFEAPTGLPPARQWDHRIHMPDFAKPINVRPYRYPYFQKCYNWG